MTTMFLTEKKSVAEDIAKIMGVKKTTSTHIEAIDGTILAWARGHLYELVEPEVYEKSWGGYWNWGQLPMVPPSFKYKVVHGEGDRIKAINALLKTATRVVLATDAGREGELIGRLILEHSKYKGPIDRFWGKEMTPTGIKKALASLLPGASKEPLLEAAKARQHSDWLYGLTGTRTVSLAARVSKEYYPLGRVQTPTLALIVRRDKTISDFVASAYYELEADMTTKSGKSFKMAHAPAESARITDKAVAEALLKKAQMAQGPLKVEKEPGKENPPLVFSLPGLQKEANRIFGFSAAKTLEIAQVLYNERKVTSYPRTDCQHLAVTQKENVGNVLNAVRKCFPDRVAELERQGVRLRDTLFDDSKLSDHDGIIPTYIQASLSGDEAQLYELICLRYLQALGQDMTYNQTKVSFDANGVEFKASDRVTSSEGWKKLAHI